MIASSRLTAALRTLLTAATAVAVVGALTVTAAAPAQARPPIAQTQLVQAAAPLVPLTDSNFNAQIVRSSKPALAFFWARWSGPCLVMKGDLEQLAPEFSGRLVIGELDIDRNPNTTRDYGVNAIPTLLLFKNGTVVDRRIGPWSKAQIAEFIRSHL
ncbi:thioredoxin family protein [Nonomuraea longicatena]|uniref:Thioredoxin domain-containing protein n=1 Tax=Nonomuraea longicatena TaxID=83682 RepID=A0ABP3ZT44_9ACTN